MIGSLHSLYNHLDVQLQVSNYKYPILAFDFIIAIIGCLHYQVFVDQLLYVSFNGFPLIDLYSWYNLWKTLLAFYW